MARFLVLAVFGVFMFTQPAFAFDFTQSIGPYQLEEFWLDDEKTIVCKTVEVEDGIVTRYVLYRDLEEKITQLVILDYSNGKVGAAFLDPDKTERLFVKVMGGGGAALWYEVQDRATFRGSLTLLIGATCGKR